jgi:hypothetical protein
MADQISSTLRKALGKLTAQKAHLDRQISAIEAALGALGGSQRANGARSRKGMSTAARKAIGKRMKAYWAKRRAEAAKGKPKGK